MKSHRSVLAAAAAVLAVISAASAQFGEPIKGFASEDVWLCAKPTEGSGIRRLEMVKAASLGDPKGILIETYFPSEDVLGLALPDDRKVNVKVVYVEKIFVNPVNVAIVESKLGQQVPPSTCISAAEAIYVPDDERKSGQRRGFGGC